MHMPRTAARTGAGVNLTVDKGPNRAGIHASADRHLHSSHSYNSFHLLSNILEYCNRLGVCRSPIWAVTPRHYETIVSDSTGPIIPRPDFNVHSVKTRARTSKKEGQPIPSSGPSPWRPAYVAASVRFAVSVLFKMLFTWLPTVLTLIIRSSAISRSVFPPQMSCNTSTSRLVNPS